MLAKYAGDGWFLDFYTRAAEFSEADLDAAGQTDLMAWARRNGALEGTPFMLGPDGQPDVRVNRFWRDPSVRSLSPGTRRRYAFSLKVWLDFLDSYGVRWNDADQFPQAVPAGRGPPGRPGSPGIAGAGRCRSWPAAL